MSITPNIWYALLIMDNEINKDADANEKSTSSDELLNEFKRTKLKKTQENAIENLSEASNQSTKNENINNPKNNNPIENFNPEELQKEFQDLIEKKFGGRVQVMSMGDTMPFPDDNQESQDKRNETLKSIEDFKYKPKDVKAYLDRFVIGQDEAKKALSIAICDHYNHLKNECLNKDQSTNQVKKDINLKNSLNTNYQKQNVLILGPTGVGKTYLVKLIADLIGVPFVKADATRFSEVGYMGANVDDIIRDLVQNANGNTEMASQGIVYVDEVDKLASRRDQTGRDVTGRGVQFGFLRLLENTDVDLNSSHDMASQFKTFMNFQKKGKAEKELVNTKNILFIFSGAFHGLEDIINERLSKKAIGLHVDKKQENVSEILKKVEVKDLINFGFEHEFIGRLPIRVTCDNLDENDLYKILVESEHSIVAQYIQSFKYYGIKLVFKKEALQLLAKKAHQQKTGARALSAAFEEVLRPFKFELPSTKIKDLEVTEDLVNNPQGSLYHMISI
jgi:ATP-dependent Clp protease ATP-binding subunit ClpX